ncbi:fumarylacetoacetate hydrolase family protein [Peribacillus acanthi]|uniref:fumarylacetoacetate hydrolase family protein n=1 Tax=Peribacillus acanthi TaxID=2171554 RepID=UPI000D3E81B5|nr:fumarylacetoacetate hydrolase family protein [Peribacillus acanthi]
MKYITFQTKEGKVSAGWLQDNGLVVDMNVCSGGRLPSTLQCFLDSHDQYTSIIEELPVFDKEGEGVYSLSEVTLMAPLPRPVSIRDFYAFEQHVKTSRSRRGLDVIPEWYDFPVFYFTNHLAVKGPDEEIERPPGCEWLDYELEIACVIGKQGRDISASEAEDYIFGYFIMNDWSSRDIQREEMKVGLGPAKGKDFATSFGPYLVSKDELESYRHDDVYDLEMTATVNGKLLSKGNLKDIYYSFGEMIERASKGVTLYPGEVIGSGTVGTGCILELGTEVHRWLEPGDEVEFTIDGLGTLKNTVVEGRR